MTRRRWIYPKDGEPFEVSADYVQPVDKTAGESVLWNDRSYQDMSDPRFKSRTQHRAYMKANDLTTMDDFKGQWSGAAKRREEIVKGLDGSRKEDVARAIAKITHGIRSR